MVEIARYGGNPVCLRKARWLLREFGHCAAARFAGLSRVAVTAPEFRGCLGASTEMLAPRQPLSGRGERDSAVPLNRSTTIHWRLVHQASRCVRLAKQYSRRAISQLAGRRQVSIWARPDQAVKRAIPPQHCLLLMLQYGRLVSGPNDSLTFI